MCVEAGVALGDACYGGGFVVVGSVKSLGAGCEKKEMRHEHIEFLKDMIAESGVDAEQEEFTRDGAARTR